MIKAIACVVLLTVVAFFTNPGPDAHRDKLKAEIGARSQLAAVLRLGSLAAFVSEYHTLGLASYATVNGRTVTYGAFGIVYVPNLTSGSGGK